MLQFTGKAVHTRLRTAVVVVVLLLLPGTGIALPVYFRYQWRSAQTAVKDSRYDDARRHLRCWLLFFPSDIEVNVLAARAARLRGDFQNAELYLNRCKKTKSVELEYLLMAVQLGEVDRVASALWRCVEDDNPETVEILRTLAGAYMNNSRLDRAYPCLTRWIKEAPDDPRAYYWRGLVQEQLHQFEAAMEDYRKAVELDPKQSWACLKLAELYLDRHNPKSAAPLLETLHEQLPERAVVAARLGQCRYLQGRIDEARELLETAVRSLPDDPALLVQLAKLDIQQKRPEKAEERLRRVLEIDPTDTEARYQLAESLRRQGRDKESKEVLAQYEKDKELRKRASIVMTKGAESSQSTAEDFFVVASIFLRSRQDRLARYWLERALQRDPNHQPAQKALAELLEKKGDPEAAARHRSRLTATEAPAASPPKPSSR
jgi:type IV pilus assembly protein PilF